MFTKATPESVGISSKNIAKYIRLLEKRGMVMHSLLLYRNDKLASETYWAPFDKDTVHRMYSTTKTYVAIAIGILADEGKLDINDPILNYMGDEVKGNPPRFMENLTIRDMLTMRTTGETPSMFAIDSFNRRELYFNYKKKCRPSATQWQYDSNGSQMLCALVEKLSGMSLFEFLKLKVFDKLGTFKTATILKTADGNCWGDSAMVCTPRDMLSFARLLLNYGNWNGEQIISESYMREATAKLVDNRLSHHETALTHGYGYQIWRVEQNGFAMVGMGDQLAICLPDRNFIAVTNCDNEGSAVSRNIIINGLFDIIVDEMTDEPLPEDSVSYNELTKLSNSRTLYALRSGMLDSPFRDEIDNVVFECEPNDMRIKYFKLHFDDACGGVLTFENEQGVKQVPFGIGKNVFGNFPQYGYYNDVCFEQNDPTFTYKDCVSARWLEEKKFMILVQFVDRYLGNMTLNFAFREDGDASLFIHKFAEYFLHEYVTGQDRDCSEGCGWIVAHKQN